MPTIPTSTVQYSDFDFRFIGHPQTGRLVIRKNADAITQAIKLLIMTNQSERPFRPFVGSTVRRHLFEPFGSFVASEIKTSIIQAIGNIEPRVIIIDVRVEPDPENTNMAITIIYRPVNATKPVEANFTLERLK